MSAKATGLIWEADLPRPEKYVLLALADHAKEDGTDVYPSLDRVQWKTGYGETQVRGIMRTLVKQKILVRTHKGGNGPTDTNRYRIDFNAIPKLQEFREWSAQRKGTENEPLNNGGKGTEKEPLKGAVSGEKGCGFGLEKGAETEPEPRTTRNLKHRTGDCAQGALIPGTVPEKAKPEKPTDPRQAGIFKAVRTVWHENAVCDIDSRDARAIASYLERKPEFPGGEIEICIVFRSLSEGENLTLPVRKWIGDIDKYQGGPLNKYGDPLHSRDDLNDLRNQARTILYGPQPEQLELRQKRREDAERAQELIRQDTQRIQREQEQFDRELSALDSLPPEDFKKLRTGAEPGLRDYRGKMTQVEFEKLVRRAMVRLQRVQKASA